jgi:hypothetical protein
MPTIYRGGCRCGAIRYEIGAQPMFAGQCHCLDCQHETGGGHASFMAFPADAVKLAGTPQFHEVTADSGNTVRRGFCATCGSPVVGRSRGLPGMKTIPRRQPRGSERLQAPVRGLHEPKARLGFHRPGAAELPEDAAAAQRRKPGRMTCTTLETI